MTTDDTVLKLVLLNIEHYHARYNYVLNKNIFPTILPHSLFIGLLSKRNSLVRKIVAFAHNENVR